VHMIAIAREAIARECGEDDARQWLTEINTDHWNHDRNWTPHHALDNSGSPA